MNDVKFCNKELALVFGVVYHRGGMVFVYEGDGKMGSCLNSGNERFYEAINSEIYVDKTGLIRYTNSVINTL